MKTATKVKTASVMKRMKYWYIAALLLSLVASSAFAAVDCRGEITYLSLHLVIYGTVTVGLQGGPNATYVCDVDGPIVRNGVSPTVCRMLYATLVAAKTTGKQVVMRFHNFNSCSEVPSGHDSGPVDWAQLLTD